MAKETLIDVLLYEAREFEHLRKYWDVEVIKTFDCTEPGWIKWPGKHKNVNVWWQLANGKAVGFNENPAIGWSFPVIKYPKGYK